MVSGCLRHSRPTSTSLRKNVKGIGRLRQQQREPRRVGHAAPLEKAPGPKKYAYTVYALGGESQLTVPAEEVSRDVLFATMRAGYWPRRN